MPSWQATPNSDVGLQSKLPGDAPPIIFDGVAQDRVLVITDDRADRDDVMRILEMGGHRRAFEADTQNAVEFIAEFRPRAVILDAAQLGNSSAKFLSDVNAICSVNSSALIIRTNLQMLDAVAAALEFSDADLILDKSAGELLALLAWRLLPVSSNVLENRDDPELLDLRKISADVERIASALAQLSGQGAANSRQPGLIAGPGALAGNTSEQEVSDVSMTYRAGSAARLIPFGNRIASNPPEGSSLSAEFVRSAIQMRRLRENYFPADLFADPAWDILLDLTAAELEEQSVSVSSLCIAANVPPTTALRWIRTMTEQGILIRQADKADGRRIFIALARDAFAAMMGYFAMVKSSRYAI
ncbi:MAG: MarR family transcriptional regulator [Parasphingorhabdus sp.]|nr:MarR family transcriptional regulator [Parasphingorhabdus sp.]